ncbi:MAG: hypothetical protein J0M12_17140 [Deltaproteobacteria bacterium]|nr:hypothetical protein [Deltaproteobacteria bacterium]
MNQPSLNQHGRLRTLRAIFGAGMLALSFWYIFQIVSEQAYAVKESLLNYQFDWLIVGTIVAGAAYLPLIVAWKLLIEAQVRSATGQPRTPTALGIRPQFSYLVSTLAKYIPGKIGVPTARHFFLTSPHSSLRTIFVLTVFEALGLTAAAFAPFMILSGLEFVPAFSPLIVLIPALLVISYLLRGAMLSLLQNILRPYATYLSTYSILLIKIASLWIFAQLTLGVAFGCVIAASGASIRLSPSILFLPGSAAAIGVFAFWLPAGLAVRESFLIVILHTFYRMELAQATTVALSSRMLLVCADLIVGTIGLLVIFQQRKK